MSITEAQINTAIAKDPGGLEAELMSQEDYRKDLWRSYGPGKYNNYAAAYIDEIVGNGFSSEDIGDVETTNAYSLVNGPWHHPSLKGKVGAILEYTDQGFVYSDFFESEKSLKKKWEEVEKYVSENTPDEDY